MSWAKLAIEIQLAILEEVYEQHKDRHTVGVYAQTCKQWYNFMHERRMVSVVVCWNRVSAFNKLISSTDDLLHMRRITLVLSSFSSLIEGIPPEASSAEANVSPLFDLFNALAEVTNDNEKYASHPGIVLRLELSDNISGHNRITEKNCLATLLTRPRNTKPYALLPNRIVKIFQVDQNFYFIIGHRSIQYVISCCHGMEIMRLSMRTSYLRFLRGRIQSPIHMSDGFKTMLELAQHSPAKCLIMYRHDYFYDTTHAHLGWLVANAACKLEHVAVSYITDAGDIFDNAFAKKNDWDLQKLHWPTLKTLILTSVSLGELDRPEIIQNLLIRVSKAVSRMPRLEMLELHYTCFNSVTIFRYTSRPPVLYIACTQPTRDILTTDVVKSWEDSISMSLTVVQELLPPNLSRVIAAYHVLRKALSICGHWYTRTPTHHIINEVADFKESHDIKAIVVS
ncbi:hypothetical protein F503_06613 [Ophiostoma piceae UAMH 11346]|uniref:DUF6546 domain-containing protein n=1 Tax=Ophiostoma piceae (strain UAMH 11346) TaxID=1262450 RepID=S3CRZ8_OPHP1|nr:hypothetical protein F503_06613 [Ophiostoma piceae UAMH 11346]